MTGNPIGTLGTAQAAKIAVALDTNVMFELYTLCDLNRAESQHEQDLRIRRLRHSLYLAFYLHDRGLASFSLDREPIDLFVRQVPVGSVDALWAIFQLYFVFDRLLPRWKRLRQEGIDQALSNNERDNLILQEATELQAPLVTRELEKKGSLRRKARNRHHEVYTPEEYLRQYAPSVDCRALSAEFLQRFDREKLRYVVDQATSEYNESPHTLRWTFEHIAPKVQEMRNVYAFVLDL